MNTYFILTEEIVEETDWSPVPELRIRPALIHGGAHAGKYAVNVTIFDAAPQFEEYRDLLEAQPTAQCRNPDLWFPPPPPPEA